MTEKFSCGTKNPKPKKKYNQKRKIYVHLNINFVEKFLHNLCTELALQVNRDKKNYLKLFRLYIT